MGVSPTGAVKPNGTDFWWDSFPGNTGNCWYGNKAAPGSSVTTSPLLLPDCANGSDPGSSVGIGDIPNESELIACLAGFTVSGYPDGDPNTCTWTATPAQPSSRTAAASQGLSSAAQAADAQMFANTCAAGLSPRLCSAYAGLLPDPTVGFGWAETALDRFLPASTAEAATSPHRLSTYTCDWWRTADQADRLAIVQRIRAMATAPINGGATNTYGYGAGLSDTRAMTLFESRCSTAGVGPFALYKLYGAAAPFAAYTGG
jgi:hypothetical protein